MPALYSPHSNTIYRMILLALVAMPVLVIVGLMVYVRTPWNTYEFHPYEQPVQFDHRHHVLDDEIDCLYCHSGAETSAYAGVPSTDLCMGCHLQVWNDSPQLAGVIRSYFSGQPIPWVRVHRLADFVYFNHSAHVQRGVGCVHCHGRVDQMARVYRVFPLSMGWCIDCHRDPAATLLKAPRGPGYGSMWGATVEQMALPSVPDRPRPITYLTTCTACHR